MSVQIDRYGGDLIPSMRMATHRVTNEGDGRIAGDLELRTVMRSLAHRRPVFHSEADFQFSLAWLIGQLEPDLAVRLEVPQSSGREYLDLLLRQPDGYATAVEVKYFMTAWSGTDAITGEHFNLRSHGADDVLRLNFIHDVTRLERFVSQPGYRGNGVAILLTNYSGLWTRSTRVKPPRDSAFRIHDGASLTGRLVWGTGDFPANDRQLRGQYGVQWHDYSILGGAQGTFRWVGLEVSRQEPMDG